MYHRLPTAGPRHPKLGCPTPVEARLKVLGFVDDVKCSLNSPQEFEMLDAGIRLFGYLAIMEELNFLGVKLARTSSKSNGEEPTSRVKNTIASYKAGVPACLVGLCADRTWLKSTS